MRHISVVAVLALLAGTPRLSAQDPENGHAWVHVPESSLESPFDIGVRAHTNHVINIKPSSGSGPGGAMTPADLRIFYQMPGAGGSGTIAIIIAYHYPTAISDFNAFSSMYGLPTEDGDNSHLEVVFQGGTQPAVDAGWNEEAALDIEWSHAMAPNAKIVLVEAQSNSFANLLAAVDQAATLTNVRQISMSWGATEFSGETGYDGHFNAGLVYFASSGDKGGVPNWPSVSQRVVAVGGTRVETDSSHILTAEKGWSGSGGGSSKYYSKPSWQFNSDGTRIGGSTRSVPDISSDADPNTGVLVVYNAGLYIFGGTSVSSPCMAGMANISGVNSNTTTFLTTLYKNYKSAGATHFRDIKVGTAGRFRCGTGWDFVTGVGAPQISIP